MSLSASHKRNKGFNADNDRQDKAENVQRNNGIKQRRQRPERDKAAYSGKDIYKNGFDISPALYKVVGDCRQKIQKPENWSCQNCNNLFGYHLITVLYIGKIFIDIGCGI